MSKAELIEHSKRLCEALGRDPNACVVRHEWVEDKTPGVAPGTKRPVRADCSAAEFVAEVLSDAGIVDVGAEKHSTRRSA